MSWVQILVVSKNLFVPLRSFFYATLANHWKVQFQQWFILFNNVDSKVINKKQIIISEKESAIENYKIISMYINREIQDSM